MYFRRDLKLPIGNVTVIASDKGVHQILLNRLDPVLPELANAIPVLKHKIIDSCESELLEYFSGKRKNFFVKVIPIGTSFQKRVWTELCKIPYGETISYSEQALRMGIPKSRRAVAAANGRNPLPILVPCHRVVASTGHLHGFSGGLNLKRKLLKLEGLEVQNMKLVRDL